MPFVPALSPAHVAGVDVGPVAESADTIASVAAAVASAGFAAVASAGAESAEGVSPLIFSWASPALLWRPLAS